MNNKKHLKRLAYKIADFEYIIQNSKDEKEIKKAENSIMLLAKAVPLGLKEMVILDEMVQEILEKKIQENLTK